MVGESVTFTPVRAVSNRGRWLRERLTAILPQVLLTPSLLATLVYVFVFSGWTIWISLSNSTLLPDYSLSGLLHYVELWSNERWRIAYTNLFLFSSLSAVGATTIGLLLAILIDQRIRAEALWRTIYLYPLAISFVETGTVWRWLLSPSTGVESLIRQLGWTSFKFDWLVNRQAGLRSVDSDLIKAAQIDERACRGSIGASSCRRLGRFSLPCWSCFYNPLSRCSI
jgi:glucose/mannose transport system permease protein